MNLGNKKMDDFLYNLQIDSELLLHYFILFSRFEYALKRNGYIYSNHMFCDWNKFGEDITKDYKMNSEEGELSVAIDYLINHAPLKQIICDNGKSMTWEKIIISSDVKGLVLCIKTIRNNLFHGGKYPAGPVVEESRNTKLLSSCIVVMEDLINYHQGVKSSFFEYV